MKINSGLDIMYANKTLNEAKEAVEKSALCDEKIDAVDNRLNDPFISMREFMEATNPFINHHEEAIKSVAEVREEKNLALTTSYKLLEAGITPKAWEAATPVERNEMMDKAFAIMTDEMKLPKDVQERLAFVHTGTVENVTGNCNLFVMKDSNGNFVLNPNEKPMVEMNCNLMYQDDIELPLRSVFHQAMMVMEQSSLTEPDGTILDKDLREKWMEEVEKEINGTRNGVEGAMQGYARKVENTFMHTYDKLKKSKGIAARTISFK